MLSRQSRLIYSIVILIFCVAVLGGCATRQLAPSARESIEWSDLWIPHANETNLPRVLLIGDSISRDYYSGVEKRLQGRAYVGRISSSAFISDPALLKQIAATLGMAKFDVIHFNNGMHGWQHTEEEYRKAFPEFLKTIQRCAPRAKLIWCSTTPLKHSPSLGRSTEATNERVAARNSIASAFIMAKGIRVDDLYSPMLGHPELHADNVHFNQQGVELQAAQVAAQVEATLSAR